MLYFVGHSLVLLSSMASSVILVYLYSVFCAIKIFMMMEMEMVMLVIVGVNLMLVAIIEVIMLYIAWNR